MQKRALAALNKGEARIASFVEFLILMYLCSNDGTSQSDIAKGILRKKSMITRGLNNLEKSGHIKRENSEKDSRSNLIYIQESGKHIIVEAGKEMIPFDMGFIKSLPAGEFEIFNRVIIKLLQYIVDRTDDLLE